MRQIVVLVSAILASANVASTPVTSTPVTSTPVTSSTVANAQQPITHKQPVSFGRCTVADHGIELYGIDCAELNIAESARKPKANQRYVLEPTPAITLNIARAPARGTAKDDPLVVITGGPGTSAVRQAPFLLPAFSQVQKQRDILFIDQRGTGKSHPFTCEAAANIDPYLAPEESLRQMQEALKVCLAKRPSLHAISTVQAAKDLESVRKALGYKSLNVWGNSYGTRVALEYQHRYPDSARTVILDGAAPAAIALPRNAQRDAATALTALFAACQNDASCTAAHGNLAQHWQAILAALEAKPASVSLSHPRDQKTYVYTLTPGAVANWARFALYSRELSAMLPLAIAQAAAGDFSRLGNLAMAAGDSLQGQIAYGMHIAILCQEDAAAPLNDASVYDYRAANTSQIPQPAIMPFGDLGEITAICPSDLTLPKAEQPVYQPFESTVPTLLLSGALDPATPAHWAHWLSQKFSNSQHIILAGGHHGISSLGCMPSLMARFIEHAAIEPLAEHLHCIDAVTPGPFFIDLAGPNMLAEPSSEGKPDHD